MPAATVQCDQQHVPDIATCRCGHSLANSFCQHPEVCIAGHCSTSLLQQCNLQHQVVAHLKGSGVVCIRSLVFVELGHRNWSSPREDSCLVIQAHLVTELEVKAGHEKTMCDAGTHSLDLSGWAQWVGWAWCGGEQAACTAVRTAATSEKWCCAAA